MILQATSKPSSAATFLAQGAMTYFPQALPVIASMTRLTADFAATITARNTAPAGSAIEPAETLAVMQVSIKPSNVPTEPRNGPAAAAFDTVAVPFKRLSALRKLAPSLAEMDKGAAIVCRGKTCAPAVTLIKQAGNEQASLRDKLNAVNAAVNKAITYRSDMETNGVTDHWATPSETLARGQGDCEDFAILKMAALRAEGFDPAAMSIIALFDQKRRLYHAVLSVEVSGRHFILDNVRNQVLQDTQLPDYVALYSIRDGKGFLHGSQRQKQIASAITSMEKIAPGAGVN
ncbi:transglutaminase-like cysteine peptidase [Rhizobium panacihumi]|uniref:transglutaminase-like cysteine peptidase n=1 Tax=Rhizobium panacihumi TaxID=2008450 RepID=UPI003D7947BB